MQLRSVVRLHSEAAHASQNAYQTRIVNMPALLPW
jgi:hypothetical protein